MTCRNCAKITLEKKKKKKHGQLHSPRRRSEVLLLLHSPVRRPWRSSLRLSPDLTRCVWGGALFFLSSLLLQPQTSRKCLEYYGSCAAAVRLWEVLPRWREMIDGGAGQSAAWMISAAVGLCGCCYSVDLFFFPPTKSCKLQLIIPHKKNFTLKVIIWEKYKPQIKINYFTTEFRHFWHWKTFLIFIIIAIFFRHYVLV